MCSKSAITFYKLPPWWRSRIHIVSPIDTYFWTQDLILEPCHKEVVLCQKLQMRHTQILLCLTSIACTCIANLVQLPWAFWYFSGLCIPFKYKDECAPIFTLKKTIAMYYNMNEHTWTMKQAPGLTMLLVERTWPLQERKQQLNQVAQILAYPKWLLHPLVLDKVILEVLCWLTLWAKHLIFVSRSSQG